MGFSWTDDDGGPGDHAGDGHIEPYAGSGASGQQTGTQDVSADSPRGRAEAQDNLGPYGTQDGGSYDSSPDNATPAGPREFDASAEHSRASAAQKPSRDRGPSKRPFDTVNGVPGADQWAGPDPVDRRRGSTTQRP